MADLQTARGLHARLAPLPGVRRHTGAPGAGLARSSQKTQNGARMTSPNVPAATRATEELAQRKRSALSVSATRMGSWRPQSPARPVSITGLGFFEPHKYFSFGAITASAVFKGN